MKQQSDEKNGELTFLLRSMENIVNVRRFKSEKLDEGSIKVLFKAFSYGPSLANQQPWECLLITNEQKEKIISSTLDPFFTEGSNNAQGWLLNVPHVFVVLIDHRRAQARLGEKGVICAIQDTFSALQNLRITAIHLGFSTSIIREFDGDHLKEILQIPLPYEPIAIGAVGYPDEKVELPVRFDIRDFCHEERIL